MAQPPAKERVLPEPRPPGSGGWIKRLSPFLMAHRRGVTIALGAAIAGQGVAALVPLIQGIVIDDGIVTHDRPIGPWLALLALAATFIFASAYLRRWVGGRVSLDVQYDLRNAIYERLQRLDFAGHDQLQTGQLVSRAPSDLGLLQTMLGFLPIVLGNLVMLTVSLVVMFILSPPLTLVMVIALPALLWVSVKMRATIFPATWDAQQRAGEVAGVVDEAVTGVRIVKGFGQEQRELDHLAGTASSLYSSRSRLVGLQARYSSLFQAIPSFGQVAVLAFGGWLAIEGHLTLGTFFAFSSYLVQLVAPVRMLAGLYAVAQQARAGAERILDVLDATPMVHEPDDAVELPVAAGEVVFEHVRFGYSLSQPVLDDFHLTVAPGEVVALVGASGSGKSTVTALLPRFYDTWSGRILVDGIDIRHLKLDSLRHNVGLVFEDAFLFSDTVSANIAFGRPDASQEAIVAAAHAAGAHQFISELPNGYDTLIGERGLTISGGQRQRVALARAILTDPRILVLDDATSAVDSATEEAIHATLRSLMATRTTILVAHRRSTLRLAQRIVVIDHGRVADQGTHEELITRSELYRRLLTGIDERDVSNVAVEETTEGVTPSLWQPPQVLPTASANSAGVARFGPGSGTIGTALSATPELLARLDRLPADDLPRIDEAQAAAPTDGPFRVLQFIRPWTRRLILGFALVALDAILTLLGPYLISRGIDSGVKLDNQRALWIAAGLLALTIVVDLFVTWAYTVVTGRTAERILFALRIKLFSHLQRLSLDYYDRELDGRIMTRMTTDVEALSQLIQTGLISAIVGILTGIGVFVFLVVLSPWLALVAASVIPPLVLSTIWYQRNSARAYRTARDSIANVNANFQESLSGVRISQAYVRRDRNVSDFRDVNGTYLSARLRTQKLVSIYFPFVNYVGDLAAVVVLAASVHFVNDKTVAAGVVIAFLLYLEQFFAPLQQLSQVFDTWQQAAASVHKIQELLATESSTPPPEHPIVPERLRGRVEFADVGFGYSGTNETPVLAGVNLVIEPGETVALVGETGAGKSTIVKLLARYYDCGSGHVTVDGIDVEAMDLPSYRRQLGIVPQEPFLFTGTIRYNIAYGRPDATDAEIEAAARAVGVHEFVATLPHGYLEPVSERGRSLSAGQRQLIALARAHLVDPVILLLDEATSQLDLASEARVQRAMNTVAAGRTTVLVAHRLPTAATADRIYVVDRGHIIEQGTHAELLRTGGQYARLWEAFETTASTPPPAVIGG